MRHDFMWNNMHCNRTGARRGKRSGVGRNLADSVEDIADVILCGKHTRTQAHRTVLVRCLKQFERPLILDGWVCHLPLVGDDAEPVVNNLVNLTPHVREDILLTLPQHPLCDPECGGLKLPQREAPSRTPEKAPSAWDELDKLKLNN